MEWTPRLTQLNDALGDLESRQDGITKFIKAAGLKPQMINFNGNALDIWCSVIDEARKQNKIENLIEVVSEKYPDNPYLKAAKNPVEINYSLSPKLVELSESESIDPETLEYLTMGMDTMLNISFLEKGVIASHSVAKVDITRGRGVDSGTGFLFKVDGSNELFFMTNFHVINDKKDVKNTKLVFNYEEDIDGNTKASKSFKIDEAGPWYTSPVSDCDVAIFKLIPSIELDQFGFITVKKVDVKKNDFVNIIQHPAGQLKKIALYHNIVTNTTDRIVQYLTDTLKGSSGAPVFNSNWDLVAIHHSGGVRKIDEPSISESKYRNEGIHINKIIDFLVSNHRK